MGVASHGEMEGVRRPAAGHHLAAWNSTACTSNTTSPASCHHQAPATHHQHPLAPRLLTVEQGAVEVSHQGADVAGGVGLAAPGLGLLQGVDVRLLLLRPQLVVALVEGVDLALVGDADVRVAQDELADEGVKGEAPHALACAITEGG